jgi:hypothetical protein
MEIVIVAIIGALVLLALMFGLAATPTRTTQPETEPGTATQTGNPAQPASVGRLPVAANGASR